MSPRTRRFGGAVVAALFCCVASGCVSQEVAGDQHVYSYQSWVGIVIVAAGLIAATAGWFIVELSYVQKRIGYGLLVGGPVAVFLIAPGLFLDTVKVDANHFEVHRAALWSPGRQSFRFADLRSIDVTERVSVGRRGRTTTTYYLELVMKSGGRDSLRLDTLLEQASFDILSQANRSGVSTPVVDADDEE